MANALIARFKKKDVDMTEGNIVGHIIMFALPLLLGNVFQQLYNTVDTWVVGNYVSNEAFSAVGSVGPIINMLIGFYLGFSSGAGVVISQYYGAGQYDQVKKTVHTSILVTVLLSLVFAVVGVAMTPYMLRFMKTPADVFPESSAYLTIYFSGIIGLMVYNMGSSILRAVGDSTRPFIFLLVSAVLNTVLDLVFVLVFQMGVEGVALATVIAQCVSAILCVITLMRSNTCVKLTIKELRVNWTMLGKVIKIGFPAALQMAITSFSNVFVQSYINHFGKDCMSGWTAYAKIDQLMFLPMQSLSLASTTFVGQNLGKNQVDRAKAGVRKTLGIAMAATVILMIPVMLAAPYLVAFFNKEPNVVEIGTLLLRVITPFYVLCCINQIYSGALRGSGNTRAPMLIMLASFVGFRQIYLFVMSHICNEIVPIALSYPAGWLLCSVITLIYYKKTNLAKSRIV